MLASVVEKEVDPEEVLYEEYRSGRYSPVLLEADDLEPDTLVYDPSEDMQRLEFARRHVLRTGQAKVRQTRAAAEILASTLAGDTCRSVSVTSLFVLVPAERRG